MPRKKKDEQPTPTPSRQHNSALWGACGIGCAGIIAFVLWFVLFSSSAKAEFDGNRAFKDLEKIVALGPRPSGSDALKQLRLMMREELQRSGLEVREDAFTANTPEGQIPMVNVTGIVKGSKPGIIIIGNHYETKLFKDFAFVGANDAGSTTAWMLEMARVLGVRREGRSVWLCFFDGEEAFREWTREDSLYGSRAYTQWLKDQGQLKDVHAMINVDMIGDCKLEIKKDNAAPTWLTDVVWNEAARQGHASVFVPFGHAITDDHIPFREAGVPAMNIIDFTYGATLEDHARFWHTSRDTLDRVCAESLQTVGNVVYHALSQLDAALDKQSKK